MDKVDLRIINLLAMDCRISNNAIAKAVDLDSKSVKARIEKMMFSNGIIQDFIVIVNPTHFGYKRDHLLILNEGDGSDGGNNNNRDNDNVKDRVSNKISEELQQRIQRVLINRINMVEDLYLHAEQLGGRHAFLSAVKNGSEDRVALLVDSLGPVVEWNTFLDKPPPAVPFKFTESDLRIIRILMMHPRMEISDIAKRLGLSTKTIARRLDKMRKASVLEFSLLTNPASMKGAGYIQFMAIVEIERFRRKEVFEQVYRDLHQNFIYNPEIVVHKDIIPLGLCATDMFTVDSILATIKGYKGVNGVNAFFMKKMTYYKEWMIKEIDKQIEAKKSET